MEPGRFTAAQQRLISAVRADERVGRGSCSSIDECYSDAELDEQFAVRGITTARAAVAWARRHDQFRNAAMQEGIW